MTMPHPALIVVFLVALALEVLLTRPPSRTPPIVIAVLRVCWAVALGALVVLEAGAFVR